MQEPLRDGSDLNIQPAKAIPASVQVGVDLILMGFLLIPDMEWFRGYLTFLTYLS
jgi:hypothetical protein